MSLALLSGFTKNSTEGRGDWEEDGCTVEDRVLDLVTCSCNHLSIFGVDVVSLILNVCIYCFTTERSM